MRNLVRPSRPLGPCIITEKGAYILKSLEEQGRNRMKDELSIGRVAEMVRMNVPTIRYYEEIGLVPTALRTEQNRRVYKDVDVRRLNFIRHAKELGFDLDSIRQLLALAGLPEEPCEEADQIARAHLADVEHKIARLTALRKELRAMVENSDHGRIRECRVIEVLSRFGNQ